INLCTGIPRLASSYEPRENEKSFYPHAEFFENIYVKKEGSFVYIRNLPGQCNDGYIQIYNITIKNMNLLTQKMQDVKERDLPKNGFFNETKTLLEKLPSNCGFSPYTMWNGENVLVLENKENPIVRGFGVKDKKFFEIEQTLLEHYYEALEQSYIKTQYQQLLQMGKTGFYECFLPLMHEIQIFQDKMEGCDQLSFSKLANRFMDGRNGLKKRLENINAKY
ncbi:MAG: hypothetical protein ACTSXG_04000, partial [Alphaproteobacteria bacterium]